ASPFPAAGPVSCPDGAPWGPPDERRSNRAGSRSAEHYPGALTPRQSVFWAIDPYGMRARKVKVPRISLKSGLGLCDTRRRGHMQMRQVGDGVVLTVRVQPRSRPGIDAGHDILLVRVAAPPVEGRATDEARRALA